MGMQPPVAGAASAPASQPIPGQPGGMAPAAGGAPAPEGRPDIASLLASIGGAA